MKDANVPPNYVLDESSLLTRRTNQDQLTVKPNSQTKERMINAAKNVKMDVKELYKSNAQCFSTCNYRKMGVSIARKVLVIWAKRTELILDSMGRRTPNEIRDDYSKIKSLVLDVDDGTDLGAMGEKKLATLDITDDTISKIASTKNVKNDSGGKKESRGTGSKQKGSGPTGSKGGSKGGSKNVGASGVPLPTKRKNLGAIVGGHKKKK